MSAEQFPRVKSGNTLGYNPGDIGMDVQYFRDYGIHDAGDQVKIFSFPDWEGLERALSDELPDSGTVVTTECATFTGPHEDLVANAETINERIDYVRERSVETDAEIWLGTAVVPPTEWHDWRNSVLTFSRGEVVGRTDKVLLSMYEQMHSPIKAAPKDDPRFVSRMGMSALICSDLIASSSMNFMGMQWPGKTLLIPSCWASVPKNDEMDESRAQWIARHGSADKYFASQLERSVQMAFAASDADAIIIADRNAGDTEVDGPFNAVFRRE